MVKQRERFRPRSKGPWTWLRGAWARIYYSGCIALFWHMPSIYFLAYGRMRASDLSKYDVRLFQTHSGHRRRSHACGGAQADGTLPFNQIHTQGTSCPLISLDFISRCIRRRAIAGYRRLRSTASLARTIRVAPQATFLCKGVNNKQAGIFQEQNTVQNRARIHKGRKKSKKQVRPPNIVLCTIGKHILHIRPRSIGIDPKIRNLDTRTYTANQAQRAITVT